MEIHGDNVKKIKESAPVSDSESQEKGKSIDSGLSSIEKSKSVRPELIPPMSSPILSVPSGMDSMVFAIATLDASGHPYLNTVRSLVLQGEEIKTSILKKWGENLKEIEEQVRELLKSPLYIQLQEIRRKGDPQAKNVSGIQGAASANAAAKGESFDYLSSLDRLQVLEKVPPSAEITSAPPAKEGNPILVLPLAAALLAGVGLSIGTATVSASNPLGGVFELVQKVQTLFPQVSVQDLIPIINLMVVAPIYYNSWNEAVSNLKSGERHNYVQTAQQFAKDVIKIVMDPHFVKNTLISRMRGTENLSPEQQQRLTAMLKIVLIGVALSLLYSVEVGKVQGGKFGGIEPEELRDLILGKGTKPADPNKKMNLQEELTLSLIKRIHEQMELLSPKDREFAASMLLDYITQPRELDPILDPAKVFEETLSSTLFNPNEKINLFKA